MADIDAAVLREQLDKALVAEVVQTERAARDQAQWTRMLACFHPDSRVETSWFQGTGPQFVAASERVYAAGARSLHQMGPTPAHVRGGRALAETGCAIMLHGAVGGVGGHRHQPLPPLREPGAARWKVAALRPADRLPA